MECSVRRENIKPYEGLLKTVKDEAERQHILKLLAEEQQKQKDAGDKIEEQVLGSCGERVHPCGSYRKPQLRKVRFQEWGTMRLFRPHLSFCFGPHHKA